MNPTNHSAVKLNAQQDQLDQFYQLHYPQKKAPAHQSRFRAKSVLSVTEKQNPQLLLRQPRKKKLSQQDKIGQVSQIIHKQKPEPPKIQPFSFKKALSAKQQKGHINSYFSKYSSNYFGSLEQIAKQNAGIRSALQKCKDQKIKVAKVLSSQRQPQTTKMDYLQLKKQQIQEQRKMQLNQIYEEYFRKQYEQIYGDSAKTQYMNRMEQVVALMHSQLFSS